MGIGNDLGDGQKTMGSLSVSKKHRIALHMSYTL